MDITRAVVLLRGIVDRAHGNDPETRLDTEDENAVREAVRVLGRIADNARLCWCSECGGEPGQPDERDRLVLLAAQPTWQPIAAYDKDPVEGGMKIVLLFVPKGDYWNMATGSWSRACDAWEFDGRILKNHHYQPTHFMSLPAAPAPEREP